MSDFHTFLVDTGTDAHECNPIPVARIHVRLYLEDKAGEFLLVGRDNTALGLALPRRRRIFIQRIQQFPDPEIIDTGTEEDRRQFATAISI